MANMLHAACQCPEFGGNGHCRIHTIDHRVPRWATLPKRALVVARDAYDGPLTNNGSDGVYAGNH